jgi:hypothetical protein
MQQSQERRGLFSLGADNSAAKLAFARTGPNIQGKEQMSTENETITMDDDDETFTEAVATFIQAATYLRDEHRPAVKLLRAVAKQLDAAIERGEKIQPALLAQYGLQYRSLLQLAPGGAGKRDELDESMPPALWE